MSSNFWIIFLSVAWLLVCWLIITSPDSKILFTNGSLDNLAGGSFYLLIFLFFDYMGFLINKSSTCDVRDYFCGFSFVFRLAEEFFSYNLGALYLSSSERLTGGSRSILSFWFWTKFYLLASNVSTEGSVGSSSRLWPFSTLYSAVLMIGFVFKLRSTSSP